MTHDSPQTAPGSSSDQQHDLADFLRRYQENPNSISAEEAARRYRDLMHLVSPDLAAEAHGQAFAGLAPQDRHALAQRFQAAHADANSPFDGYQYDDPAEAAAPRSLGLMAQRARRQDQQLFGGLLGENSPLNSTLGKLAMAGVAAYLASKVLSNRGQQAGNPQAGGLDLGGLLGALAAAQAGSQSGAQGGNPQAGGLDLGGLLGALAAAQAGSQSGGQGSGGQAGNPQAGGLDLGGLLGALAAAQAGSQSGAQGGNPQAGGLDLGGLLGALGGAQGGNPQAEPQPGAESADPPIKKPDLSVLLGGPNDKQGGKQSGGPDLSALLTDDPPKKDS